jgi:hypothetical protein
MSTKKDFEAKWKVRFPEDSPPLLECFETRYGSATELKEACQNQHVSTRHNIEMLQKELHQQEFISTFLWDLLNSKVPLVVPPSSPTTPTLDSDIPLPNRQDGSYHGYCTVPESGNVVRQASNASAGIPQAPESKDKGSPYNKHRAVSHPSPTAKSEDTKFNQDKPQRGSQRESQKTIFLYPALTKSGSEDVMSKSVQEKARDINVVLESSRKSSSLENLDLKRSKEKAMHRASSDSDSLDDKSKPIPAPRPSVHGPSFKEGSLKKKPGPPTTPKPPKPVRTTSLDQSEKAQPPTMKKIVKQKAVDDPRSSSASVSSTEEVPIPSRVTSFIESKTQSSPTPILSKSATIPAAHTEETIYDAPIPVNREVIEEEPSSSDDEEPVYYNILLMKQQTLKNRSLYANVDTVRKKHMENEARKLTNRFSKSIDNSAIPVKPPVVPGMYQSYHSPSAL